MPMVAAGVNARSLLTASAPKIMPMGMVPIIIGIVSLAPLKNSLMREEVGTIYISSFQVFAWRCK